MCAREPQSPQSQDRHANDSKPGPSPFGLWLAMAWDEWLKTALAVVSVLGILVVFWLGVIPSDFVGVAIVAVALLVPLGMTAAQIARTASFSPRAMWFYAAFGLIVTAVALTPIVTPLLDTEVETQTTLATVGETARIPALESGERWYMLEVEGDLPETDEPYDVSYLLRLENDHVGETMRGDLKRSWSRVRVGRRTQTRKLTNHERVIHRFTADLGQASQLTLKKMTGAPNGPLRVLLRAEPVMLNFLLAVDLPLLLAAGLIEVLEENRHRYAHLTSRTAFMLIFGAVFADNWLPGVWIGPIIMALIAASLGALLLGILLPKLLRPVVALAQR